MQINTVARGFDIENSHIFQIEEAFQQTMKVSRLSNGVKEPDVVFLGMS